MAENGATIGTAFVHVVPSAEGIKGSLTDVLSGEAESAGTSAGVSISGALKRALIAAGIGTTLKRIVGDALNAGGALQQSFGGIETLYGEAADEAKAFAMEAAAAGISANTYAEQAVSFGAALKQAFAGDTYKAMEAANTAIMDMADNAAKFGTDITAVQTAYQGFAKQNYTMLDNLKLGYGGTKTEMERLLKDAEALSGVHYDLDNLGDVYAAIHVIQDELGVAGVAATEAATTLTGSAAAVKAAWQNVLAGVSLGDDVTASMETLLRSINNYLTGNLIPMIGNVLRGLPAALGGVLMTDGIQLMQSLATGIQTGLPELAGRALPALLGFAENLRTNVGIIVDTGLDLIKGLARGLINALPLLIEYVPQIITNIAGIINDNMPKIIKAGIEIIVMLGKGIIQSIPVVIANMGNIVQAIISVVSAINWVNLGASIINLIANGIKGLAAQIPNALRSIGQTALNGFKNINWSGLGSAIINGIVNGLRWSGGAIKNVLLGFASDAFNAARNFFRIGSPSKLMRDEIGKMIPAGMAVGIEENTAPVYDAMGLLTDVTTSAIDYAPATTNNSTMGDISVNVYGAVGQDVEELAQAVADRINAMLNGQRVVYG